MGTSLIFLNLNKGFLFLKILQQTSYLKVNFWKLSLGDHEIDEDAQHFIECIRHSFKEREWNYTKIRKEENNYIFRYHNYVNIIQNIYQ